MLRQAPGHTSTAQPQVVGTESFTESQSRNSWNGLSCVEHTFILQVSFMNQQNYPHSLLSTSAAAVCNQAWLQRWRSAAASSHRPQAQRVQPSLHQACHGRYR